jgi:hypothetical protein
VLVPTLPLTQIVFLLSCLQQPSGNHGLVQGDYYYYDGAKDVGTSNFLPCVSQVLEQRKKNIRGGASNTARVEGIGGALTKNYFPSLLVAEQHKKTTHATSSATAEDNNEGGGRILAPLLGEESEFTSSSL